MSTPPSPTFKCRTITAFIHLTPSDVPDERLGGKLEEDKEYVDLESGIYRKIKEASEGLQKLRSSVSSLPLEVQTVRISTNTFTSYLPLTPALIQPQILHLHNILALLNVGFFSLGPCTTVEQTENLPAVILPLSPYVSVSSMVSANDYPHSLASAKIIKTLSTQTEDGINNFRYCVQSNTNRPCTPFFPGSYGPDEIGNIKVSIGLENGILANVGLGMCKNPHDVGIKFLDYYKTQVAGIVRTVAEKTGGMKGWEYAGLDSSLNPSLEPGGSVAQAIEDLPWVNGGISGVGVVGAAASITTAIQNLGYMRVGYCGIMLPVCEDRRLSEVQMGDGEREGDGRYFNVTHLMNVRDRKSVV